MYEEHIVYLFVRKTVDWQNEVAFYSQLSPAFAPKVDAWNRTFRMPYHLFRHAIRMVAIRNHESVSGLTQSSWEAIPAGAIVVPSDDDDWLAPDLSGWISRHIIDEDHGIYWTQSALEVPINAWHRARLYARGVFPWMRPKWLCATNNYGVRKTSDTTDAISHVKASRRFGAGDFRVSFIPRRLSIHNRTLASITSMGFGRPTISATALRKKADEYRRLYDHPGLAKGLEWAKSEVTAMKDVMANLKLR